MADAANALSKAAIATVILMTALSQLPSVARTANSGK